MENGLSVSHFRAQSRFSRLAASLSQIHAISLELDRVRSLMDERILKLVVADLSVEALTYQTHLPFLPTRPGDTSATVAGRIPRWPLSLPR
jgi:hypothetical protein